MSPLEQSAVRLRARSDRRRKYNFHRLDHRKPAHFDDAGYRFALQSVRTQTAYRRGRKRRSSPCGCRQNKRLRKPRRRSHRRGVRALCLGVFGRYAQRARRAGTCCLDHACRRKRQNFNRRNGRRTVHSEENGIGGRKYVLRYAVRVLQVAPRLGQRRRALLGVPAYRKRTRPAYNIPQTRCARERGRGSCKQ